MAGKVIYDYPPDDELVALVAQHGSVSAVAKVLNMPRATLAHHIERQGIRDRCNDTRVRAAATVEDVPVTDPARVRADQAAAQIKALKRENADYAKALASQEEFFDRIVEATRVPVERKKYKAPRRPKGLPTRSAVLPIYDQQFGQLVRASDTPGHRGGFSTDVYDERQARYVDGVIGHLRDYSRSHQLDELIFALGGDHVEGDEIFAGQPWQLELDPARQVWELATRMTDAVEQIVQVAKEELGVKHIALYGCCGNHGRVGGRRGGARPATYSWDWLFLKLLADRLRGEPIDEVAIEPEGLFFYAAGLEFQAVHGEHIRGWGGLPYYGIARYDAKSVRLHNRVFRYLLLGHHHQPATITSGSGAEAIVSGDWVGANNLSGVITAASRPQQRILYVAEKWGITEDARIYLTSAEEAHAPSRIYGRAA